MFKIQGYDTVEMGENVIDVSVRDWQPLSIRSYILMRKSLTLADRIEKSAPDGIKPEHKQKAAAKLKQAGATRWITIHPPDGDKGRQGVPVMIRENGDGTAHVVGGAGGRLNMLKLRGIKSPEEYHEQLQQRKADEREKKRREKEEEKKRLEEMPKEQQERAKAQKRLERAAEKASKAEKAAQTKEAEDAFLQSVAERLGWNTNPEWKEKIEKEREELQKKAEETEDEGKKKAIEEKLSKIAKTEARLERDYQKSLVSQAREVVKSVQEEALRDPETKSSLEEIVKEKITREKKDREDRSKGYATKYKEQAKEKGGLEDEELKRERDANLERRLNEIGQEKGEAVAQMIRSGIETNREYSRIRQEVLTEDITKRDTAPPEDLEEKAEIMKAWLEYERIRKPKEPKKAEQINIDGTTEEIIDQVRKEMDYGDGLYLGGLEEDAFGESLEREKKKLENERMGAVNSALLERIDENDKGRLKYQLNGVYNGLNSIMLTVTRSEGLNRDVVDLLGLDNAARLTAGMLSETLDPDDYDDIREAIEDWHATENETIAADALSQGEEYLAKAEELRVEMEATNPDDLHALDLIEKQRSAYLEEANRVMAQAVGSLEASAALAQAMKHKGMPEAIDADLGEVSGEDAIIRARAMGLQDGDYEINSRGGHRFLSINGDALDKLTPSVDADDVRIEQTVASIKGGDMDDPDWLPDGIEHRLPESFEDPGESASFAAGSIENQSIGEDATEVQKSYEAAHRVLGSISEGSLAFVPTDDLTPEQQYDLRKYWEREVYAGSMAEGTAERDYQIGGKTTRRKEWNAVLKEHGGDEESVFESIKNDLIENHAEEDMFGEKEIPRLARAVYGDHSTYENNVPGAKEVFDQYYDLQRRSQNPDGDVSESEFKAFEKEMPKRLDNMYRSAMQDHALYQMRGLKESDITSGEREEKTPWGEYVRMHGGPEKAAAAVQDVLKSRVISQFSDQYAKVTGKRLQTEKREIRNARDHVLGLLPKDARDSLMNRVQAEMSSAGARVENRSGGKFASGSWRDKAFKLLQQERAEAASQSSLFGDDDIPEQDDGTSLVTIGDRAEKQLASIVGELGANVRRGESYQVAAGMKMSGKHIQQQRAIKMLDAVKRTNMTFGTGKGKSIISIGAFAHLKSQGKANRAVFAVPSVVQAQFGSEINKYATPGKFSWFNTPNANREERISAMKDGSKDMVFMTHQSLRDDLTYLMAQKLGKNEEETKKHFNDLPRDERRNLLQNTLSENEISFDMGVIDESHYTANRKGKSDTTMSNVLQALTDNTEYFLNQSATPVKNDASEAFDMLSKVDPKRFTDRDEFLKRYGVDTEHSKEALQRLINRYNYASPTDTGVQRSEKYETVSLSDSQTTAYREIEDAAKRASKAQRSRKVDVEAMKALSPNSFAGAPEDKHEEIARKLQPAVGTIREEALNRVVNQSDWKSNAKVSRLTDLISQHVYDADNPKTGAKAGDRQPGVVFAHNLQTVENITSALKEQGLRVGVIRGDMNGAEKEKVKTGFNPSDPSKREYDVVVLSDAGATGLNMQNAKYLVNFDQPHTSWVREQRMGRIDRHGQAHDSINYYDIVTDTEHEKKRMARVKRKAALGKVFQTEAGNIDDTGLAEHINRVKMARKVAA